MISIDIKDVLKCLRLFWSKYISPEPSNLGEPNPPDNLLLTGVLSRMSIIRIQSDLKLGCERLEVLLYRLYKNRYDPAFDARKTDDEIKTLFYLMRYDLGRLQSIVPLLADRRDDVCLHKYSDEDLIDRVTYLLDLPGISSRIVPTLYRDYLKRNGITDL